MRLWYNHREFFNVDPKVNFWLRFILIEEGSGILHINKRRLVFMAPAVFFLNETEYPTLEKSSFLKARAIYFHPSTINSLFNFSNIRGEVADFLKSDFQDLFWLQPFLLRTAKYNGYLNVNYQTLAKMSAILDEIKDMLTEENDYFWQCRSRAVFLQLLSYANGLKANPSLSEEILLHENMETIDQVILHLNSNYHKRIEPADLASRFYLDQNILTKQFNRVTGMSIPTYLNRIRVRSACIILENPEISLQEVVHQIGIEDYHYFNKIFKKQTGVSPTDYRRQLAYAKNPGFSLSQV